MMQAVSFERRNTRWVEIANSVSAGLEILKVIAHELEQSGFPVRQIGTVELAFTEAVINAVRHGNQDDPHKSLLIEYGIFHDQFHLSIEDEGPGFCPNEVDDPTLEENMGRPGGRGLLLIRSLMENVAFNPRGNRISMRLTRQTQRQLDAMKLVPFADHLN